MNRMDNSLPFVFKTILFNNRFKKYKEYIEYALKSDYKVCSMAEFYGDRNSDVKHFVLRHDVDDFLPATREMFEIEKKMGVHSTYYFRWSTIDEKLIADMLEAGFDVGLHYETVATYIRENNIKHKDDINISIVQSILKDEIKRFKIKYNQNMTSCCSHGAPENRLLDISSNVLLENVNYEDYGIVYEAYDKDLYTQYDIYHIMDQNIRFNFGFAYKSNPIEGINLGCKNIVFLAHPTHWKFGVIQYLLNITAFILGKVKTTTNREFRRIAK